MYGHTDSKVRKFIPQSVNQTPKNEENVTKNSTNEEMENRLHNNYPRFRGVRPHELKDDQELAVKNDQKQKEYSDLQKRLKLESGAKLSFIQKGSFLNEISTDEQSILSYKLR